MSMVRLEFPIDSGIRGVEPAVLVPVRNLRADELEALQGADADTLIAVCTGLSPDQVRRLTSQDRAAIVAARRRTS